MCEEDNTMDIEEFLSEEEEEERRLLDEVE